MTRGQPRESLEVRYLNPVFQALTIKTTAEDARGKVEQAIAALPGEGWSAQNYSGDDTRFEVVADEGTLTPAQAWELTYKLRTLKGIAYAEPVFKAWVTDRRDWGINVEPSDHRDIGSEFTPAKARANLLCGPGPDLVEARDNE